MLETLREYAAARLLARGEHVAARDRHADHYRARAQAMIDAALAWRSALPFVDEFDDVRAALRWCRDTDAGPERAFTILVPLWGLAPAQHAEDIAAVAEEALAHWPDVGPLRLHALGTAATARLFAGDGAAAHRLAHTALDLEEQAGETALLAPPHDRPSGHVRERPARGGGHHRRRRPPGPATPVRTRWPASATASPSSSCTPRASTIRRVALAARMRDEADRLDAPFMVCWSRYVSGVVCLQDDPEEARRWLDEAVARGRVVGHHHMVRFSLRALGVAALLEGDHDEAAARLEAALGHDEERSDAASQWTTLTTLALLLAERDRPAAAAQLLAAAAGWPASPILAELAERARRRVAAALDSDEQAAAARRGERLDLEAAKALARAELGQATMRSATRVAGPRAPERRPTRTTTS